MRPRLDRHADVRLHDEGLRRADNDNALHAEAERRERRIELIVTACIWLLSLVLGVLLGMLAMQTAGFVS